MSGVEAADHLRSICDFDATQIGFLTGFFAWLFRVFSVWTRRTSESGAILLLLTGDVDASHFIAKKQ